MDELELTSRLVRVESDIKALFNRIDKSDKLTENVHSLASDVRLLAQQVKAQGDRFEQIVKSYDAKLKSQGDRISELEKKPAHRWEKLVTQVIGLVVAAVIGAIIASITR